ncbi:hypothetical protein HD806DRAFT_546681 [Xylariaceae sp. AK1471]|nr:hypothetical protein HD806DRAFT_546681 [Xylariaceae sp. AK1471]
MPVTIPNWTPGRGIPVSAEIPIMDEYRHRLLCAFHGSQSYYELWHCLRCIISQESFTNSVIETQATVEAVRRDHERQWTMLFLLQIIPRGMMSALLLGTVAVEYHPSRGQEMRLRHYDGDGPGVYVAQISVEGRQGRGLNRREMTALVDVLLQYVQAFDNFKRYIKESSEPVSQEEHFLDKQAESIDGQFGKKPGTAHKLQPRFISGEPARKRVCELISMLQRRCIVCRDQENDDGEAWQVSLPSMVGCADNISERIPAHHPDSTNKSSMSYTTYTFALVTCALMELGLKPEVTTVPVLRIYDAGQLPAAEMLVTLLASSLVTQDGYNVVQGGNKPGKLLRVDDREYVMARCPYLRENQEKTIKELHRRQQFLELKDKVQAEFIELSNDLKRVDDELDELQPVDENTRQAIRDMKRQVVNLQHDNLTRAENHKMFENAAES